jgi:hypothetical protein
MSLINGMNYSQWQQRNTNYFNKLPKDKKQKARDRGYFNVGWEKVKKSWEILIGFTEILSLFENKIKKGDISGAINFSILEAEQAQKVAKDAIKNLDLKRKELNKVSRNSLNKYQLL